MSVDLTVYIILVSDSGIVRLYGRFINVVLRWLRGTLIDITAGVSHGGIPLSVTFTVSYITRQREKIKWGDVRKQNPYANHMNSTYINAF